MSGMEPEHRRIDFRFSSGPGAGPLACGGPGPQDGCTNAKTDRLRMIGRRSARAGLEVELAREFQMEQHPNRVLCL